MTGLVAELPESIDNLKRLWGVTNQVSSPSVHPFSLRTKHTAGHLCLKDPTHCHRLQHHHASYIHGYHIVYWMIQGHHSRSGTPMTTTRAGILMPQSLTHNSTRALTKTHLHIHNTATWMQKTTGHDSFNKNKNTQLNSLYYQTPSEEVLWKGSLGL